MKTTKTTIKTGLLITGVGRSGTTLLWQLLNTCVELRLAYEPYNFGLNVINFYKYNGLKQPTWHWNFEECKADKYLFIKRDIIDNLYSLMKRNCIDYSKMREFYAKIIAINAQIDRFKIAHPTKALIIDYKELCTDYKAEMVKICEFLKINCNPQLHIYWYQQRPPKKAVSAQYSMKQIIYQTGKYLKDDKFMEKLRKTGIKYE